MNLSFRNYKQPQYLQEGGTMEDPNAAPTETPVEQTPAPEQGGDPMQQLLEVAAQALHTQDCQAAMTVCQALMLLAQGGDSSEPQGQPVYGKGGKLLRRI